MAPRLARLAPTALLLIACAGAAAQGSATAAAASPIADAASGASARPLRQLNVAGKRWTGDFDQMLKRRLIRVDVPFSRSLYFLDKGRERGLAAELVRDMERAINQKYAAQLGKRPLTVYIVAATRDKLVDDLREGRTDIAVGNLTVTPERLKLVDFVAPDDKLVNVEILVTGPNAAPIASVEELSGRTVHVRVSSSYNDSLARLNTRFQAEGKAPVNLVFVPDALEDEDMLEMLNAGLLESMVVDDWKARMWAQVLPRIKVNDTIVLREATKEGWAIRKDSPQLAALLTDIYETTIKKSGAIPHRQKQYMKAIKQLHNPTVRAEYKRYQDTIALFEKYGRRYDFDPLMLAAQGYQESRLDQNAKSHVGAIGVMQIMPATGAALNVGDIRVTESNIHAGAKYMDQLITKYFPDAKFSEYNRPLFAFASYNCGPGNVAKMRKEAARRGLDPDKWFNNVEVVTSERIGIETTTYVRNIYKYYVSYKLIEDARAQTEKVKLQVAPLKK